MEDELDQEMRRGEDRDKKIKELTDMLRDVIGDEVADKVGKAFEEQKIWLSKLLGGDRK